jgi:hypothetical protein
MSLDDLTDTVTDAYADLGEETSVSLDRETRNERAMLVAAYDPDDPDEILRRAVHELFQRAVETGNLDFHLRSGYDCTYDEYLSGMTYEDMAGGVQMPDRDGNERRYQF